MQQQLVKQKGLSNLEFGIMGVESNHGGRGPKKPNKHQKTLLICNYEFWLETSVVQS